MFPFSHLLRSLSHLLIFNFIFKNNVKYLTEKVKGKMPFLVVFERFFGVNLEQNISFVKGQLLMVNRDNIFLISGY